MFLASTPITLGLAIAFAASFVGIVFVIFSKDARLKRVILPLTLLIFSAMVYVIIQRAGALASWPSFLVPALLLLNAAWVFRSIRSCDLCGRSVQVPITHKGRVVCGACGTEQRRA